MTRKRLLIYCGPTTYTDDLASEVSNEAINQLQQVNNLLAKKGMKFAQYTSKENAYERDSARSV